MFGNGAKDLMGKLLPPIPAALQEKMRHWRPYWLPVTIPFTSVSGEQKTVNSDAIDTPLIVLGAMVRTSINATMRMFDTSTEYSFCYDSVPILNVARQQATSPSSRFWPRPYFLKPSSTFRFEFTNAAAEAAGTLSLFCLWGEHRDFEENRALFLELAKLKPYWLPTSIAFTGSVNDRPATTTNPTDSPVNFFGAQVIDTVASTILVSSTSSNYQFQPLDKPIPISAFAALGDSVDAIRTWPNPYRLEAYSKLSFSFTNPGAEAADTLTLHGLWDER